MPPKSDSPKHVSAWLHEHFIHSFRQDVDPTHWPDKSGFFAIPLLTLSYANAAAGLVHGKGDATSIETINFIHDYLGHENAPSASRYRERAAVLYTLYRHGLSHQREPGRIKVDDSRAVTWSIERGKTRDLHMWLAPPATSSRGPELVPMRLFILHISADLLWEDTGLALEHLALEASRSAGVSARIYAGACAVAVERDVWAKPKSPIRQKLRDAVSRPDSRASPPPAGTDPTATLGL